VFSKMEQVLVNAGSCLMTNVEKLLVEWRRFCFDGNLINLAITTIQYPSAYTLTLQLAKVACLLTLDIEFSEIAGRAPRFAISWYPSCINLHMAPSLRTLDQLSLLDRRMYQHAND
jgi:hypothetical protein